MSKALKMRKYTTTQLSLLISTCVILPQSSVGANYIVYLLQL